MHRMGRRHRTIEHYRRIPNPIRRVSLQVLDALDLCVYVVVGTSFVIAAVIIALGATLRIMGDTAEAPEADPNLSQQPDEKQPVPVQTLAQVGEK
jgi:hypothetical protein